MTNNYNILMFGKVLSTNDIARRAAENGAVDWTVIDAIEQIGGRGQHGRVWISPPGNLYLSLITRPQCQVVDVAIYSIAAAVAVANVLKKLVNYRTQVNIKWPNDVLVNNKKIAGLLLESSCDASNNYLSWLVSGIGLNIVNSPDEVVFPAISLTQVCDTVPARYVVRDMIIAEIVKTYSSIERESYKQLCDAWRTMARSEDVDKIQHVV